MLTEEKPPVIESALLILGNTIERKHVIPQKIEVTIRFLNLLSIKVTYILVETSVFPVII